MAKANAPAEEMPRDKCGSCYFCYQISVRPGKPFWCFVKPPYPMDPENPDAGSMRGAMTAQDSPACDFFKPRGVH